MGDARRRRIALISSSFHPHFGGVEEHTLNVAREFASRGHAVVVWTVDRGENLGRGTVEGIEVRYLPTPLPAASPGAVLRFIRAFRPAWRLWRAAFDDFRPEVLHVQCFGPNGVYALALHHRTRTPMIVSSHGETFADDHAAFEESAQLRWALAGALRRAHAVTGCSQYVLDDLARFAAVDGVVVPNGVDFDEPSRVGTTQLPYSPTDGPTVFAIGRIEEVKGFDVLIRAFAQAELPRGTTLVIAGDGSRAAHLRRLAAELGVGGSVMLPGRLSRAQVLRALVDATVVVVPSRLEAFGIVVLEAWRSGRPVVASAVGGLRELVSDGVDGVLVDPADVSALADALVRVVCDPGLQERIGAQGRETVRRYTWAATAERYLHLYPGGPSPSPAM